MKQTKTFIVFRDKESGRFLTEYKNNEDTLAFTAGYKKEIQSALFIPEKYFEKDKEKYDGLLQALGAEPLKVKAEYTLTTLDGEEPEEIKVDNHSKVKEMMFAALDDIFRGDD
ncbi:hypothetical protein MK541_08150 [Streptococcus gallolyticus subsp. gallolyticus]|uniref:hypothetical protein n=1 Tax=Streptococcus gallolyticus TaxID=315405 RepID=UPI002284D4CE|nr:hypothetical protein [Streptococcus gallolyticus]MCY7152150.1 hypothetical protein [Streptococcus gallolyticus subsp. gallolyticus]